MDIIFYPFQVWQLKCKIFERKFTKREDCCIIEQTSNYSIPKGPPIAAILRNLLTHREHLSQVKIADSEACDRGFV